MNGKEREAFEAMREALIAAQIALNAVVRTKLTWHTDKYRDTYEIAALVDATLAQADKVLSGRGGLPLHRLCNCGKCRDKYPPPGD